MRRRTWWVLAPLALLAVAVFTGAGARGRDQASTPRLRGGEDSAPSSSSESGLIPSVSASTLRGTSASGAPDVRPSLTSKSFRVSDPDGRPLAAKVRVALSHDAFKRFETLELEAGPDGKLPLKMGSDAWVLIQVHAPGRMPVWQPPVAWEDLEDADLALELPPAVRVDGSGRWSDGRPMADVRLAFQPVWPPGEFAGQVASRMNIVDEEIVTDAQGRFRCESLGQGPYRVLFPDHPRWPALTVSAEDLSRGALQLRTRWPAPPPK